MVATFGNSEWVTPSEGSVQSKSVTSCAGMTAHLVLLAQTRVGFLSGGGSKRMKNLSQNEFLAQLEEAYARATVALTRAQKLCIIMGLLDMRGLLGAATVISCLKHGAGVCGMNEENRTVEMYLKENSIDEGADDCSFLDSLRRSLNTTRGVYPPVALAEIYCEDSRPSAKIRRLHLIVIDLDRSWNVCKRIYWQFHEAHLSAKFEVLLLANFLAPIGLEHFFDAIALIHKQSIRAAVNALGIPIEDIQANLVVKHAWALIGEWTSRILFPKDLGHNMAMPVPFCLSTKPEVHGPRIVGWARASFEQGALPSLLLLQGLVPIFSLPGDRMFQPTGICQGRQRPPIMHAYGGAKIGMAQALRSIASEDLGLLPVIGTTVDIKITPLP